MATINELNDPFELLAADLSNKKERQNFLAWKNEISKKIGFLCFSLNKRNPLLWSHYAQKHKGLALEFEVSDELVIPVRYRQTRQKLDLEAIRKEGGFSASLAERLGSTKYIDWEYEDEVRVPVDLTDCINENRLLFRSFKEIIDLVKVHAGPLCDISRSEVESQLPKGQRVTLHFTRTAFRSFTVVKQHRKKTIEIEGKC
ncbi:MAG: DUF2971 domain-containing protein [Candidatus Thiodiazotropha lotti]|nr:DUF2971 domain-containing protein [Candidatus Thiodiazotropha lotti]MCG8006642.1 DUF2971 domain-containing protein [Candidatus Thiodiazotropha lotti]MCW4194224.1 DUF2971 domain-containing protein [Candidatus Thiodiazotropha lotti]